MLSSMRLRSSRSFKTNYHGGLKTYQWTNIPLALMGRFDKKDGTTVQISLGNEPGEPIFIIPDLSPHVDRDLRERKSRAVIAHEELDPLVGHKVGRASGRTIDVFLSDDSMDVIDLGVPVKSIHTTYSISSKIDVYFVYRTMLAFFSKRVRPQP